MRALFVLAALLLLILVPVVAQNTPKAEIFGGYSFVAEDGMEQILHGWNASVSGNINDWLGIKGDLSAPRPQWIRASPPVLSLGWGRSDRCVEDRAPCRIE